MKQKLIFFLGAFLLCIAANYAQGYKSHKVEKGETVKTIAEKYGIEPYDIYKYNPEAQGGIRENAVLIIPSKTVKVTKPVVNGNAKDSVIFKIHKVKRKETLYSLHVEYGVSVDEIKKYNKELYSRDLRKGEEVKIPIYIKTMVQQTIEENPKPQNKQKLKEYTVQKSEGLFRIASNHGITTEALKELNPGLEEPIQEGQVIWVPVMNSGVEEDKYDYYTVQQGEGFYRIEKNTGFSEAVISKLNPQIAMEGLKEGMILKIPKQQKVVSGFQQMFGFPKVNLIDSIKTNKVTIALVLPFKTKGMSVDSVGQLVDQLKTNKLLNVSLDFYSGALEAVDSLAKIGLDVHLKVLDSNADETAIDMYWYEGKFDDTQAVIGPLYDKLFNKLASKLYLKGVPIFAPLSNKNIEHYANVFSTIPESEIMSNALLSYIKKHEAAYNMLIFADDKHLASQETIRSVFPEAKVVTKDFISLNGVTQYLVTDKKNLVFVETNSVPMLTNITNILNASAVEGMQIQLTTTSKGEAFNADSVQNEYLNNLNFLFANIDKPASYESGFFKTYFTKYKKYPNAFAVRGMDVTMDVALRLAMGKNLQEDSNFVGETSYVENKFHYITNQLGCYTNNSVYILMYKDMEVVLAP